MTQAQGPATQRRQPTAWRRWIAAVSCMGFALWVLFAWIGGKGPAIAAAAPATTSTPAAVSAPLAIPTPPSSNSLVFPALVPDGEPESILGVKWDKGVPKFENAPVAASAAWAVAWSPDGRQLATGSDSGLVRRWDAATGKELRRLEGHSSSVTSVAFSPDGNTLASASRDESVRVWDAALSLELPTRKQIEARLAAAQIRLTATDLDLCLERLELGYVLLREADANGPDRYRCTIPLIPYFESRIMNWDEHLERDADEIRSKV